MNKNKVIIIGAFHEMVELCEACRYEIAGIIDNHLTGQYHGHRILGSDAVAGKMQQYSDIPLIITPDNPDKRKTLALYYAKHGFSFANIIHPKALVSRSAIMGKGVVVQYGVNISSNVQIHDFVRINTYANIMHDCSVGNYTTIAPNAVLLGGVTIGERCYVGSNCTILPDRHIADAAIVGAGAVVINNVADKQTVVGNPAHRLEHHA